MPAATPPRRLPPRRNYREELLEYCAREFGPVDVAPLARPPAWGAPPTAAQYAASPAEPAPRSYADSSTTATRSPPGAGALRVDLRLSPAYPLFINPASSGSKQPPPLQLSPPQRSPPQRSPPQRSSSPTHRPFGSGLLSSGRSEGSILRGGGVDQRTSERRSPVDVAALEELARTASAAAAFARLTHPDQRRR